MRRRGQLREIPPPLELECLKALWSAGQGNVKDVRQILVGRRNLAYTTVMTVLERLLKKGVVARQKVGRSFVYSPVLSREALRRLAVKELVDGFFDGSEEQLLEYLKIGDSQAPVFAEPEIPESAVDDRLDTALL